MIWIPSRESGDLIAPSVAVISPLSVRNLSRLLIRSTVEARVQTLPNPQGREQCRPCSRNHSDELAQDPICLLTNQELILSTVHFVTAIQENRTSECYSSIWGVTQPLEIDF